ncbi:hypothetical protein [Candidatus Palauibacter sp.]|uniref:hypothetical protein n=1 Tax=Candidatus Palauibacter sp. TaxID=3101350 RepID=UPI003B528D1C
MRSLRTALGVVALLVVTASPSVGQVIEGPDGPVEFVGLKEWSASDLFDAIQELAPDQPFHACAAVMEMELGFAEAAAMSYRTVGSDDVYTVVVGVEDSAHVRPRAIGSETLPLLAEVWALIDGASSQEDRRFARELLARDASRSAREIATLVLGNFVDRDASWHGLVLSMTDPEDRVAAVAGSLLQGLIYSDRRRPVDWSQAREPLLAHFGGTNPWSFNLVLRVLVATEVDPEFGRQLARERPDLLLAYAGAEHRGTQAPAIAFLMAISGEDFGTDLEAWTTWLSGRSDSGRSVGE